MRRVGSWDWSCGLWCIGLVVFDVEQGHRDKRSWNHATAVTLLCRKENYSSKSSSSSGGSAPRAPGGSYILPESNLSTKLSNSFLLRWSVSVLFLFLLRSLAHRLRHLRQPQGPGLCVLCSTGCCSWPLSELELSVTLSSLHLTGVTGN